MPPPANGSLYAPGNHNSLSLEWTELSPWFGFLQLHLPRKQRTPSVGSCLLKGCPPAPHRIRPPLALARLALGTVPPRLFLTGFSEGSLFTTADWGVCQYTDWWKKGRPKTQKASEGATEVMAQGQVERLARLCLRRQPVRNKTLLFSGENWPG